jgi:hypothetical protein
MRRKRRRFMARLRAGKVRFEGGIELSIPEIAGEGTRPELNLLFWLRRTG